MKYIGVKFTDDILKEFSLLLHNNSDKMNVELYLVFFSSFQSLCNCLLSACSTKEQLANMNSFLCWIGDASRTRELQMTQVRAERLLSIMTDVGKM